MSFVSVRAAAFLLMSARRDSVFAFFVSAWYLARRSVLLKCCPSLAARAAVNAMGSSTMPARIASGAARRGNEAIAHHATMVYGGDRSEIVRPIACASRPLNARDHKP